jgi:hypothetical protein
MLFRQTIVDYTDNRMEIINTLCGKDAELMKAKVGGTQIYHSDVRTNTSIIK